MSTNAVWKPSAKIIANANISRFMVRHEIKSYDELIQRATTGVEWFWDSCVHETGIDWFEPYTQLLDLSQGPAFARWFVGGRLNIAHNCVDRHALKRATAGKVAVIWQGECGAKKTLTYQDLYEQSSRVANYLKSVGVGAGDSVALYMPMVPELIPIFFGILKIGAVVVPIFSGYGAEATSVRLNDAAVRVVFTVDGTLRRGQKIFTKTLLNEALKKAAGVKHCVVVKRLFETVPMTAPRDVFYDDISAGTPENFVSQELVSEHPAMILYTSGTTGKPKGTVHTHAGTLAQVTKELFFNFDLKPRDVFFWVTDIGWMMGPWEIIGVTHFGATLVIAEGMPTYPQPERVVKLARELKVTHLGVSPTLVRVMMREGAKKIAATDIKTLKMIGSTGEPWDNDSYLWCYKNIGKSKVPIMNISGGTEIMGCLLAPLPIKEIKPCSLQSAGLGMAVDIFNEFGGSVGPNEVGYLVCKKPAPSMTKGFLNDRERYLETYYSKFKNIWNHGDWAVRDDDGHWYLRGRADDTIKVAGKRTGPAEIESSLCENPFVSEACAIGVPDELKGEEVVCFVVLATGIGKTDFLVSHLKAWVAFYLGKTLKPKMVYVVSALPKTRSGKIVRGTIKKKYIGSELGDLSSIENPALLEAIPQI